MRLRELALLLCLGGCATGGGRGDVVASSARLSSEGRMHLGLAQGYLDANQVAKASERLKLAASTDPGAAEVHAMSALIHVRNGEHEKAGREFDRALRSAPSDGAILNAHASWLCQRGEHAKADAGFARALRDASYQNPFQTLYNAGRCAHQASDWAKAESYLRRALAVQPQDRQVLQLLAEAEFKQGQVLEARAFIQRRDSLGADARTLELAASIEDAANDRHAAARYRQRLKEEFPNHVPATTTGRNP